MKRQHIDFVLLAGCVIVLALVACGNYEPGLGPDSQAALQTDQTDQTGQIGEIGSARNAQADFFPLVIGDQWKYSRTLTIFMDGGPGEVFSDNEEREIVGTMSLFDRDYFVYQVTSAAEDDSGFVFFSLYRQDRAGLYSADVADSDSVMARLNARAGAGGERGRTALLDRMRQHVSSTSPPEHREAYLGACDRLIEKLTAADVSLGQPTTPTTATMPALLGRPGGVLSNEITILKYPLHPGQQWTIRSEPFEVTAEVVDQEVLDLAPGMINCSRLRIDNSIAGPDDVILEWFGRAGFVREFVRATVQIIDVYGNVIGTMVVESDIVLDSLSLSQGRWKNGGTADQF